jgi:tetratricopeptide (TPR) repeat protein
MLFKAPRSKAYHGRVPTEVGLVVESSRNKDNLDDLLTALRCHAGLIPFVGAGLSRPFGFPEWGAFLRARAQGAGVEAAIDARLAKGEYEEAAEDLQEALGALAFEDAIRRTFGSGTIKGALPDAAVRALPALATGPVLTTNFDRVLESVFEEAGQEFEDIVWGAQPSRITQALHVNVLMLWKLHGDYKTKTDRVLTHGEYTEHYGHSDPAQVDWQKPLPRLFDNLLAARPVLFLGSSLDQDRTVRILGAFAQRHPGVGHYALLEDPADDPRRHARARALSNVGVRPLWFPQGRFDLIGPFLNFLAEQNTGAGNRHSIASQRARIEQGIDEQRHVFADSAAQGDAQPQRVVGDPPDRPARFHGRATQLQAMGEHLTSTAARLVTLIGPSGIGKTALAVRLLTDLEANRWPPNVAGRQVDGIAYLSTRTEGITLERLFFACARMLGGAARANLERAWKKDQLSVDDKIQRLLEALHDGLYVILLDHIEDLLDGEGQITDAEVRLLVDRSLAARNGPRLLVTSRVRLALSRDAAKLDRPVSLNDGLSVDDGIAMLRDLDRGSAGLKQLPEDALARVVKRLHGVPRALEVFAGILADDELETVDHLLEKFYDRHDVVDDLFKEGINRLDEPSQRVVEALAVLGQPVPAAAVDLLLQPFVPGLDLPAILRRLSRGQIVRVADRVKGTWALHPIDQDFAYARCPETGRYSRQALHHRAAEWYASVRTPREMWRTVEGLEPLLREFDHRVKAGLYDDAAAVLAEFDEEFVGAGNAARSLAMHLQLQGRITIDRIRLLDMLGLAHAYRHIGPLDKAIAIYKETLAMARAQQNATVEIESLGWMGETYRRLTLLDEGVVAVQGAVAASRRANDRSRVARWLGELALTSCYRGELKEALAAADEAYQTAAETGDVNWEALAIDALALVHLARGEPEKAIQAAERTLSMYEGAWQHTVIYVLNVLGLAYLDLQQIDKAIECLERARVEARVCEDVRVEGMAQFNLAHAHRLKGDVKHALEHAEAAVEHLTRTQGGELPAAQALASALRARAAGMGAAEARALVAVARACLSNPDLRNPRAILADAAALAGEADQPDVAAEAMQLLAQLRERDERAHAAI